MVVSLQISKVQVFVQSSVEFLCKLLVPQFFKLFYSSEGKAKGGWTEEKYFRFAFAFHKFIIFFVA